MIRKIKSFSVVLIGWLLANAVGAVEPATPTAPNNVYEKTLIEILNSKNGLSMEALIRALPKELKENRMEIFDSRSIQCATTSAPRVVLGSKDGQLMCSFNSGKAKDYIGVMSGDGTDCSETLNVLECISFNPNQNRNHTLEIHFPEKRLVRDSNRCTGCHGLERRHIMDPYPAWPGFYGMDDDSVFASKLGTGPYENAEFIPEEVAAYKLYLSSRCNNKNSRYCALPLRPFGASADIYQDFARNRPNLLFTTNILNMTILRLKRELLSVKNQSFLPLVIGVLGKRCGENPEKLFPETWTSVRKNFKQLYASNIEKILISQLLIAKSMIQSFEGMPEESRLLKDYRMSHGTLVPEKLLDQENKIKDSATLLRVRDDMKYAALFETVLKIVGIPTDEFATQFDGVIFYADGGSSPELGLAGELQDEALRRNLLNGVSCAQLSAASQKALSGNAEPKF